MDLKYGLIQIGDQLSGFILVFNETKATIKMILLIQIQIYSEETDLVTILFQGPSCYLVKNV